MPSHLSGQQMTGFRQKLQQRYKELREEISRELVKSDQQHFIDLAEQVHDLQDASVADLLVDLGLATIDRYIQDIRDIDVAMMRMAQGGYGVCIDCDDDIPLQRLEAYPTAIRCTPCQERYERTHSQPGRSSL